ncbi:MAG: sarcosine oxidase subunit alpha family protein [Bauldia sp.]|nr:sarcosine oxidase subunit alpha family protein [Bauldia sp.]
MSPFRTATGGRIDWSKPVEFTFDGRVLLGFAGDTLASALLANGVHLVGRSFKYHRPRGILSAGAEEPNALVTVDRGGGRETPNLRATQVELYDGLGATSQNRWPSLTFDIGAANNLVAPLFPTGFYYKTFMWPAALWAWLYEPAIRASAGLGRAPRKPDPDRYLQRYAHCDVLVVGAGAAGIAAASAAAEAGARVILCDETAEFGGSLLHEATATVAGQPADSWAASAVARLAEAGVTMCQRMSAFGYFADNLVGLVERVTDHLADPDPKLPRERLWQVRAKEVVLATGAIERPLVFSGNDRPGIMLADAARTYLNRYGVKAGSRAVVVTDNDSAYRAALDLHKAGVTIAAIADLRVAPDGEFVAAAKAAGIAVKAATTVVGTRGWLRVRAADLGPVAGGYSERIACDLLLMSGGWTPSVHLFSQSRGRVVFDEALQAFVPGKSVQRERSAGACKGTSDLAACVEEGRAVGEAAARAARASRKDASGSTETHPSPESLGDSDPRSGRGQAPPARGGLGNSIAAAPVPRSAGRGKAFVDFQNDVTAKDLKLAVREGFRSIEHIKRYTTTGMATDQGKTSNMNALRLVADELKRPIPTVGLTTFRMPYTPVTFGALAGTSRGDLFDPVRKTPIHDWAEEQGAVFENVGLWKRARYFPRGREDMDAAVMRECRAVRTAVGIFDATTLGKIEVVGPDAAEFLNRMYTNAWTKLEVGRCRYGLMLTEAGFVMDDGVIGRLAPDRFHVTTTTGGAPRVLHHMEDYLQTGFENLKVWLTSVTEEWAVIAVQGRHARDVVAPLVEGIDVGRGAMPHMSIREGSISGVPARLMRVSFSGELGFEINVPSRHGRDVLEAVYDSGRAFGITPYGTEAMHVLRAEKGFIIVGQDSDGTVIPDDLGLSGMIGKAKPDFVGKRSLMRPDMLRADRKQLVGLMTVDPKVVLEEGAQVAAGPTDPTHQPEPVLGPAEGRSRGGGPPSPEQGGVAGPAQSLGHVTSSYMSSTLGRSIALAMISAGRERKGQRLFVPMPVKAIAVDVVDPVFYDPEGTRLNG